MQQHKIWIGCDTALYVENVTQPDKDCTPAEVVRATGTATLYSDVACTLAVSGASNLTMSALPGQAVTPASFRAIVPAAATSTLTYNSTYYLRYSLVATNAAGSTFTIGDTIPVTADYLTTRF